MRIRRSTPLLLILLAVTAGLLGMHTIGHLRSHSAMPDTTAAVVTMAAPMQHASAMVSGAAVSSQVDSGRPHGMPMDPATLCLAILCTLAIVLATLTVLRWRRLAADLSRHVAGAVLGVVRGPPDVGIGLRLADLSVLRN